jgi:hypothetical protein
MELDRELGHAVPLRQREGADLLVAEADVGLDALGERALGGGDLLGGDDRVARPGVQPAGEVEDRGLAAGLELAQHRRDLLRGVVGAGFPASCWPA